VVLVVLDVRVGLGRRVLVRREQRHLAELRVKFENQFRP
jgi:hypothetical protein